MESNYFFTTRITTEQEWNQIERSPPQKGLKKEQSEEMDLSEIETSISIEEPLLEIIT